MITNIDRSSHGMFSHPYQSSASLDQTQRRRRVATAAVLSIVVVVSVIAALMIIL